MNYTHLFSPYTILEPIKVKLTGVIYKKGEHKYYKDFEIIECVDEKGIKHHAFKDELKKIKL